MRLTSLLALFGLLACQQTGGPALVQVTGATSSPLREGDALELRGNAFPEGRRASVTLRGEVSRAGEPKLRGFELALSGQSTSPHTVSVDVTRAVERAFTGTGSPSHATFRGTVEVSFAPRVAGTPPVTGQLPDLSLDFLPAEGDRALAEERREAGRKFAEFIGLLLLEAPNGLVVDGVMPKSPAERAGVLRGDHLVELAGTHLLELADLLPPPRARTVELVIERPGAAERGRLALGVDGFRPATLRDFGAVASVVTAVLALCLFLASPFGRALSFLEWRLVERFRAPRVPPETRARVARRRSLRSRFPLSLPEAVALVLGSGLVMALGLGRVKIARELDVPIVLFSLFAALAVALLLFRAPGERGFGPRLYRVLAVCGRFLPVAAAVAGVMLGLGSFGSDDLALSQGPLPWQWLAFRGPVELGLAATWLVALLPEFARGRVPSAGLEPGKHGAPRRASVLALLGQFELSVLCGVFAIAFLGGARVSFAVPGAFAPLALTLAGAAVLLLKTWFVGALLIAARALVGRVDIADAGSLLWRGAVPASLVFAGAAFAASRAAVRLVPIGAEAIAPWAALGACSLLGISLARRVALAVRRGSGDQGLNPWI